MTASESKSDAPVDRAAGKEEGDSAERSIFVSPFREKVVTAVFIVHLLLMSAVVLTGLIIKYMEVRERCQCRRQE